MIRLPAGVTMADVEQASDSVSRETLNSSPFAERVTATLDLYGRALRAIGREGKGRITSILRSSERNSSLPNASQYSHHLTGYAVDFYVPGVESGIVFDALKSLHPVLRFDELAVYDDGHIHLSADPRSRGKVLDFRSKKSGNRKGAAAPAALAVFALVALALFLMWGHLD